MKRPVKIKQQDVTDCGAACLASVGEWYGVKHPVSRIRQWSSTDQKGTNVLGMIEAAEKMGFLAKGVRCTADNLQNIPVPLIAHLKLPDGLFHYVVVYRVKGRKICYMDPANGSMKKISREEFKTLWTGVMIILTPLRRIQTRKS
jgi:ATP-binding cassette subfamily B protein